MKIHIEQGEKKRKFLDLKPGDLFMCQGEAHMKCLRGSQGPNAVRLRDGELFTVISKAEVLPLKGVLEVRT